MHRHPCLHRSQLVELWRICRRFFETAKFDGRVTNGEASAVQSIFATVYHASREYIATLTSIVFGWWKRGEYINIPTISHTHHLQNPEIINFNSRTINGEASSVQSIFASLYRESKQLIAILCLEFGWWNFGEPLDFPSKSSKFNGR